MLWKSKNPAQALSLAALLLVLALLFLPWQGPRPSTQTPGFFQVQQREGTWSFLSPQGQRFFSIGINVVNPADEEGPGPRYRGLERHGGDLASWQADARARLRRWHVNTIGAWSSLRGMPYAVELSLSYSWIDVFGEPFERLRPEGGGRHCPKARRGR